MKYKLSPEQEKVITFNDGNGPLVVNAAAGSGKTLVLTERVRYLLSTKGGKFRILCLTFTNKAAEEMKERLNDISELEARSFIGTLHSFALTILIDRRHDIGYAEVPQIVEKESDRLQILKTIIREHPFLLNFTSEMTETEISGFIKHGLEIISEGKRQLKQPRDENFPESQREEVKVLFEEYNSKLKSQNLIDYDDILLKAWSILNTYPSTARLYRKIFKYIMIDEAQDLSFAQYELIKVICGNELNNVFMVGDPNQAIHGYAGASKEYMQKYFIEDFKAKVLSLKYNYRSAKRIIEIAKIINPTVTPNTDAFYEGDTDVKCFRDEKSEAEWIINKIKAIIQQKVINGEEISLCDIAIIARNRFIFNVLIESLDSDDELKNSYSVKRAVDPLSTESHIMKLFDLSTRILCNPKDTIHLRQLISGVQKYEPKLSKKVISSSLSGIDILSALMSEINDSKISLLYDALKSVNQKINKLPEALETLKKIADLHNYDDGILICADVNEWTSVWKKYVRSGNNHSLADFRSFAAMSGRIVQKADAITLSVVHMVKGLEFHTVFLMGMNEGVFPDYRAIKSGGRQLDEEQNTVYVAVTRAKRQLYISYPKSRYIPWGDFKPQDPSRYLKNIDYS